jgi:hypothetical protein
MGGPPRCRNSLEVNEGVWRGYAAPLYISILSDSFLSKVFDGRRVPRLTIIKKPLGKPIRGRRLKFALKLLAINIAILAFQMCL